MTGIDRDGEARNDRLVDWWSLTHIAWGLGLALFLPAYWALVLMVLWEPFELLVLSRTAARFGIRFGHESLRNSLMDLVMNVIGVTLGAYVVRPLL